MRKRVNISLDPLTYDRLQDVTRTHGFKTACELVAAMVHVLLDRLEPKDVQRYDLPDDDDEYLRTMFDDLAHSQPQPTGDVPKRIHHKSLNDYGQRRDI